MCLSLIWVSLPSPSPSPSLACVCMGVVGVAWMYVCMYVSVCMCGMSNICSRVCACVHVGKPEEDVNGLL